MVLAPDRVRFHSDTNKVGGFKQIDSLLAGDHEVSV
jgi:hypothetical protein